MMMKNIILLLLLLIINYSTCKTELLDNNESYHETFYSKGPTIINIVSTAPINVKIEFGNFIYRCENVTTCVKLCENQCPNSYHYKLNVVSLEDNNFVIFDIESEVTCGFWSRNKYAIFNFLVLSTISIILGCLISFLIFICIRSLYKPRDTAFDDQLDQQ